MHIVTATFHGATLYGFEQPDGVYVALEADRRTRSGLDWSAQLQRVKRDAILAEGMVIMPIPFDQGGDQECACLRLDLLNGWLFGISAGSIRNETKRAAVLTYQRECFRALAMHFAAGSKVGLASASAADAAAEPLHIRRSLVTEARQTHGTAAARELWFSLGLPTVPAMASLSGQGDLFGGRAHG